MKISMKTIHLFALVFALLPLTVLAGAQSVISPNQALQAVRQFMNAPNLPLKIISYSPRDNSLYRGEVGRSGAAYSATSTEGDFFVIRATDGAILWWVNYEEDLEPDEAPAVTRQQAQTLAEQFARQHYPATLQGQWKLWPEALILSEMPHVYRFRWTQTLDAQWGTLAPYPVEVKVEAKRGRVFEYLRAFDRPITISTVPQMTLQQAMQIAAPYALYDVTQAPFQAELRLAEDSVGVQFLTWDLSQYPNVGDPDPQVNAFHCTLSVRASNGAIWSTMSVGFSGGGSAVGSKRNKKIRPLPLALQAAGITVRPLGGQGIGTIMPPVLENNHVWMRAELLRALGGDVQFTSKALTLHVGKRTLTGAQVGAKWRDQGWWVALKVLADKAGWQVTWLPFNKEAVVDTDPAKTAALRQRQPTDHAAPQDTKANGAKADSGKADHYAMLLTTEAQHTNKSARFALNQLLLKNAQNVIDKDKQPTLFSAFGHGGAEAGIQYMTFWLGHHNSANGSFDTSASWSFLVGSDDWKTWITSHSDFNPPWTWNDTTSASLQPLGATDLSSINLAAFIGCNTATRLLQGAHYVSPAEASAQKGAKYSIGFFNTIPAHWTDAQGSFHKGTEEWAERFWYYLCHEKEDIYHAWQDALAYIGKADAKGLNDFMVFYSDNGTVKRDTTLGKGKKIPHPKAAAN